MDVGFVVVDVGVGGGNVAVAVGVGGGKVVVVVVVVVGCVLESVLVESVLLLVESVPLLVAESSSGACVGVGGGWLGDVNVVDVVRKAVVVVGVVVGVVGDELVCGRGGGGGGLRGAVSVPEF